MPESEAMEEMSKRLTSGWTMLDSYCPISQFPLISKDGTIYSIRCKMEVLSSMIQNNKKPSDEPIAPGPITIATTTKNGHAPRRMADCAPARGSKVKRTSCVVKPTEPRPKSAETEAAREAKSRDNSKEIGQYLLKGWRMLDEYCPVTGDVPLMENPADGRKWSVAVHKFTDEIDQDDFQSAAEPTEPASEETSTLSPSPDLLEDDEDWESIMNACGASGMENTNTESSKKESRQISDLLLQGWMMLDETCPVTGRVPLMQNQEGRKFSVATDSFLDDIPAAVEAPASTLPASVPVSVTAEEEVSCGLVSTTAGVCF